VFGANRAPKNGSSITYRAYPFISLTKIASTTALANISGRPLAEVQTLISSNPDTPGKDRLARVLDGLGIKGTPNNAIVQNALTKCLGEIPPELFEVPQKIKRMLGLS
jgi:hypothetical protein